ncbi:MAG: efflux transporter outer membrane subunit [Alphaproteobacteria bacterium]|jgi:multidrug efflux system outer membrane protein|nr:efflux transporter outer membrane subunit [Alphaproteobacteria bacterium]
MKIYFILPLLLLGSCVGPDYERPNIPMPKAWKNQAQPVPSQQIIETAWWQNFQDCTLEQLVDEASKSNLDYMSALARVREARANLSGVEALLFPTINGIGEASRSYSGKNVPRNPSAGSSSSQIGNASTAQQKVYMLGFDATWELDFFGAIRRGEESALASFESVIDLSRDTLLTLVAEIARNYITLRSDQQQLEDAQAIVDLWTDNLSLITKLEKSGLNSKITTEAAISSRDQALAAIPTLEGNIKASIHRLSVLLGKDPTALYDRLQSKGRIPHTPDTVIAGLPSDLIQRRPDIRSAERLLAASTADIGVAIAALFPHFQLTGNYLFERNKPSRIFTPQSQFWQYALNFSVPIFDFGKIQAGIDARYAQKDEACLTYQKAILTAFEEVENGLVNFAKESNRFKQLKAQADAQERAYKLTNSRYKGGLNSYLDVIIAKIALLNTKITSTISQATVSLNLIALYKALGGGWEVYEPAKEKSSCE